MEKYNLTITNFSINIIEGCKITYKDGTQYSTKNPLITVPICAICTGAVAGGIIGACSPIYYTSRIIFNLGKRMIKI